MTASTRSSALRHQQRPVQWQNQAAPRLKAKPATRVEEPGNLGFQIRPTPRPNGVGITKQQLSCSVRKCLANRVEVRHVFGSRNRDGVPGGQKSGSRPMAGRNEQVIHESITRESASWPAAPTPCLRTERQPKEDAGIVKMAAGPHSAQRQQSPKTPKQGIRP